VLRHSLRRLWIRDDGYIMLHTARRLCTPEQWETIQRLPQTINDSLNDIDDASAALLMKRLGVSEEVARRWSGEDRKWTATEALECSFVNAVDASSVETASW
jgi:hypothetical protein